MNKFVYSNCSKKSEFTANKYDKILGAYREKDAGVTNHALLSNLDYASAGHTGFAALNHSISQHTFNADVDLGTHNLTINGNITVTGNYSFIADSAAGMGFKFSAGAVPLGFTDADGTGASVYLNANSSVPLILYSEANGGEARLDISALTGAAHTIHTFSFPNVTGTFALGTGTINEIAYWAGANTLGTLAVATYPSLTELTYVKGVTSAIQTQLGNKQPLDSTLTSIALLGTVANKGLYTTGVDTWAEFDLTAAGRALIDDATAAAQATTLGLGTGNSPTFAGLNLGAGTAALPAISRTGYTDDGIYWIGDGILGISIGGSELARFYQETSSVYAIKMQSTYPRILFGNSRGVGINTGAYFMDLWNSVGDIRIEAGTAALDIVKDLGPAVIDDTYFGVRDNSSGVMQWRIKWGLAARQVIMGLDCRDYGVYAGGRLLLVAYPNESGDYAHPVQANPTLFIHSATAATTATNQWISFAHDGTNGVIGVGAGALRFTGDLLVDGGDIGITADPDLLQLASGALTVNGTINATGGFKDNGLVGIDTTFLDADGNTITVSGGIITAKTAP